MGPILFPYKVLLVSGPYRQQGPAATDAPSSDHPRQRPRSIPPPAVAPPPKVQKGLSKPADHDRFAITSKVLNPEETRKKAFEERKKLFEEKRKILQERQAILDARKKMSEERATILAEHQATLVEMRNAHYDFLDRLDAIEAQFNPVLTKKDLENALRWARMEARFVKIRARRWYMEEVIMTRLSTFRAKAQHDLGTIQSSIDSVRGELGSWHEDLAKHRQTLVAAAYDAEITQYLLLDPTDGLFAKGRKVATAAKTGFEDLIESVSITRTSQIHKDLVRHGISNSPNGSEGIFALVLTNYPLRRVLIDLAFWSIHAREVFNEISYSLHHYRRLRTNGLRYKAFPAIFGHDYLHVSLLDAAVQLNNFAKSFEDDVKALRYNVSKIDPPRWEAYGAYPMRFLPEQLTFDASTIYKEYMSELALISISREATDLPLQLAQYHDFRPFTAMLENFSRTRADLSSATQYAEQANDLEWTLNGRPPNWHAANRLDYLRYISSNLFRETHTALNIARMWRAVANVALGLPGRSAIRHSASMEEPHDDFGLDLDIQRLQSELHDAASEPCVPGQPWLTLSRSFYAQQPQIPIHYVTTARSAEAVLQQLASSSVLGIDLVMNEPPKVGRDAMKSRINFLLIASELAVAIFDMDCMHVASEDVTGLQIFQSTLGNQKILKVGVHTELQRRILAFDNSIELVNAVDLAAEEWLPGADSDPTFGTLSTLTEKNFGQSLPQLVMTRNVLYRAGKDDPSLYFGHLASRPYAALQLLTKTRASGNLHLLDVKAPASLGPLLVHSLPGDSRAQASITKMSPSLCRSSLTYISELAEGESRNVLQRNDFLRTHRTGYKMGKWRYSIISAYVRLTTFNRPVVEVHDFLWPTLRRKIGAEHHIQGHYINVTQHHRHIVCATILLAFARIAKLPLNSEHENELQQVLQQSLKRLSSRRAGDFWLAWADRVILRTSHEERRHVSRRSKPFVDPRQLDSVSPVEEGPRTKPVGKAIRRQITVSRRKTHATGTSDLGLPETALSPEIANATEVGVCQDLSNTSGATSITNVDQGSTSQIQQEGHSSIKVNAIDIGVDQIVSIVPPSTSTIKAKREIEHKLVPEASDADPSVLDQQENVGVVQTLFKPFFADELPQSRTVRRMVSQMTGHGRLYERKPRESRISSLSSQGLFRRRSDARAADSKKRGGQSPQDTNVNAYPESTKYGSLTARPTRRFSGLRPARMVTGSSQLSTRHKINRPKYTFKGGVRRAVQD